MTSQYIRSMATVCQELIYKASDGTSMVDFAGDKFKQYIVKEQYDTLITEAKSFVQSELATWSSDPTNVKLRDRYRTLDDYLDRQR